MAAATVVLRFWSDSEWNWVVTLSILLLLFTVNCIGARSFAETEYWLSMIKVIAVILFVIIGVLVDVGAFGLPPIYFDNYYIPDAPFKNGVQGVINVLMMAFFSFGGTELVGLTAGETKDPKRNVPKAVHGTFLRILLFYISSIFVMGLVIRHDDPRIQFNNIGMNPTVSPFTLVFELVPIFGSRALAHVMNFVILSAVLSAGKYLLISR